MPLLLGQLVYTSFPGVGFRTLASARVSIEIQQAFVQQIVYQHWDSYNPPSVGYRAAYLHQVTLEDNLFGWLYNDGLDELGRSHVPYFICYYLAEPLHPAYLERILTCLQRGPVALVDRQHFAATLDIITSDWWSYQPARLGVVISSEIRAHSCTKLKQGKLLDLLVSVDEPEIEIKLDVQTYDQQKAALPIDTHHLVIEGIQTDIINVEKSAAETLTSHEEYQKQLQLSVQVLRDLPSTGTAVASKKQVQPAFIPSYRSFLLFIGIGVAATLALLAATYKLDQRQDPQLLQKIDTLEASAGWQNVQAQNLSGHSGTVWSVVVSPDGHTLMSGSEDKTIRIWNLQNGKLLRTLSGYFNTVRSVAISPDGQTLVSAIADGTIRIQNLGTGQLLHTLSGHSAPVWSIAVSPDGQTLFSSSGDKTIKAWDLGSGKLLRTLSGHTNWVFSVAISPDGQTLASGSKDKTIKIWNLQSGKLLHTLTRHTDTVRSVAISPDGQTLVSGGWDKTIRVWNLGSGKLLRTFSGHTARVVSLAISSEQTLVSGSLDQTIKIWDLQSGNLLRTLSGHTDWVLSVAISPDQQTLVSGSKDKTIKVWR